MVDQRGKTVVYTLTFREHPEEGCEVEHCAAAVMHELEHWFDEREIEVAIDGPVVATP